MFPLYEVENGKYRITRKVVNKKPVVEYLKMQGRFSYLGEEEIKQVQEYVDREWEILLKKEEFTKDW
jgi:pyruvate/2-oxoacid:ferredoxin oxidoreductase beta subunit